MDLSYIYGIISHKIHSFPIQVLHGLLRVIDNALAVCDEKVQKADATKARLANKAAAAKTLAK